MRKKIRAFIKWQKQKRFLRKCEKLAKSGLNNAQIADKLHVPIVDIRMERKIVNRQKWIKKGYYGQQALQERIDDLIMVMKYRITNLGHLQITLNCAVEFDASWSEFEEALYILQKEGYEENVLQFNLSNGDAILLRFLVGPTGKEKEK